MSGHDPYSRVEYRKLIAWPQRIQREWPLLEQVLSSGPSRRPSASLPYPVIWFPV